MSESDATMDEVITEQVKQMDRLDWLELVQTLAILGGLVALGVGLGSLWAMNLVNAQFAMLSPVNPAYESAQGVVDTLSAATTWAFVVFVVGLLGGLAIDIGVNWERE